MAKASKIDFSQCNIHELLKQRRQIASIWGTEDVQEVRPDLNEDQAWVVLQRVDRVHDCNYGTTWDTLKCVADDLFPAPESAE